MFDIYAEPSFDELENLAVISQCQDEFVYLLGKCFCKNDVEQIKAFARSLFWFTYRKEFPTIGGSNFNTDVGWGCMLRCGQMLLANTLSILHLGRNWEWRLNCREDAYRRLLSLFEDQRSAPFSIHQIAQMGVSEGKPLGEWFGPNTIAQVLKKLTVYDEWSNLAVHIAMDNILISDDVRKMAELNRNHESEPETADGSTKCDSKWTRPLLIIVPLRLGLTAINECYAASIKEFFKLPQCAGIIGGRPNHAVYFFGQAGDKLLYLDPHVSQKRVDISYGEERLRRRRKNDAMDEAARLMNYGSRLISTSPQFSATSTTTPSPLNVNIPEPNIDLLESAPTSASMADDSDRATRQSHVDSNTLMTNKLTEEEDKAVFGDQLTATESPQKVVDQFGSNSTSIVDMSSSAVSPEANNGGESSTSINSSSSSTNSSSSNLSARNGGESDDGSSTIRRVELSKVKYLHSYSTSGRRRPTTKPQKIISPLSYSSELSSGGEAIGDQLLQHYDIDNPSDYIEPINSANDTETYDLPDLLSAASAAVTDYTKTATIIAISASSSSSTEMIPPLVTSTMSGSSAMDHQNSSIIYNKVQGNFEFVESESAEFSNTTTEEDERRDDASAESEKLREDNDLFTSGKRKVVRQKRKMKRNDTFTYDENIVLSDEDNEFEKVKPRDSVTAKKISDSFQCDTVEINSKAACLNVQNSNESAEEKSEMKQPIDEKNQEAEEDDFDDSTYHCSFILNMDFKTLDPSLALAFICLCAEDYDDLKDRLNKSIFAASKSPLFEILESRPAGWPEFVPYSVNDDELLKIKEYDDFGDPQFDSDDQFELLV